MGLEDIGVCHGSKIYFTNPSEFANRVLFTIPCAGDYQCNSDYFAEDKGGEDCVLLLVDEGKLFLELPGHDRISIRQGNASLFNGHRYFKFYADGDGLKIRWIRLRGSGTEAYVDEINKRRGYVFPTYFTGVFDKYVNKVFNMLENRYEDEHILSVSIHRIFAEIINNSGENNMRSSIKALDTAIRFMHEHLGERITLEDIASQATFSQYHFSRLFKSYKGVSPYEYLIVIRIQHAKELLYTTDESVEDISALCGFESSSYFIRQFKKREHLTPYQFRKQRM